MWRIVIDFLLVALGMGIGITLMCVIQVGKMADEQIEKTKWRNEE